MSVNMSEEEPNETLQEKITSDEQLDEEKGNKSASKSKTSAKSGGRTVESTGAVGPKGDVKRMVALECLGSMLMFYSAYTAENKGFILGFLYALLYYTICSDTGAQFNPAISLGVFLSGQMELMTFLLYSAAHFVAGLAAAFLLACFNRFSFHNLGGNTVDGILRKQNNEGNKDFGTYIEAILIEMFLTFLLTTFYISLKNGQKIDAKYFGIAFGAALYVVLSIGYQTSPSLNPARSFGPALLQSFASNTEAIALYICYFIGPLLGGALGGLFAKLV